MKMSSDALTFYRRRDLRTVDYLGDAIPWNEPVSVHGADQACSTPAGQLLLATLANQLGRVHRHVCFSLTVPDAGLLIPSLCGGANLGDEIQRLLQRIDPYGRFRIEGPAESPSRIAIGVGGDCRRDLAWYLGCDRSNAELATRPRGLGEGVASDLRGAGLAALLGGACVMKRALNIETVPTKLSAWNFTAGDAADPGPLDLPAVDVGRGLMVGAGAVAAGVVYWLMQWGNSSDWTIVDADRVKLHNTNRSLLFFPEDAGWMTGGKKSEGSLPWLIRS